MPQTKQLTNDILFTGGLNSSTNPTLIADNEARSMDNMVIDERGYIQKRLGSSRYNSTPYMQNNEIQGIYRAYKVLGGVTKKLIVICGKYLWADTTLLSSTVKFGNTTTFPSFMTYNNIVYITEVGAGTFLKYDFSTLTDITGSLPAGGYLINHREYAFQGNVNISGNWYNNRLYFSNVDDPETWRTNNYEEIGANDNDLITGLGSLNGILYIFKRRSIYVIVGDVFDNVSGDSNFSIQKITDFGCISPKSLINTGNEFIFLAHDGIRNFNGSSSTIISDRIKSNIDPIFTQNRQATVTGGFDVLKNYYYFAYPSSGTVNNAILVLDMKLGRWYPLSGINANYFSSWNGSEDKNEFLSGDSSQGFINYLNQSDYHDPATEIMISTCEEASGWSGGAADTTNFKEGITGRKVTVAGASDSSSATLTLSSTKNLGTDTADLIHFWVYHTTRANIDYILLDLDTNDGAFTTYFRLQVNQSSLTAGDNKWTEISSLKSAFTTEGSPVWTTVKYVKITLVTNGSGGSATTFDDIRHVDDTNNVISANYYTKRFDFGKTEIKKHYGNFYLEIDKTTDFALQVVGYIDNATSVTQTLFNASTSTLTDYLLRANIFRVGKNYSFGFLNSTIDQNMKLIKMSFSYKPLTLK